MMNIIELGKKANGSLSIDLSESSTRELLVMAENYMRDKNYIEDLLPTISEIIENLVGELKLRGVDIEIVERRAVSGLEN